MSFVKQQLSFLHLSGNKSIGNAGAAALAAALRTASLLPELDYNNNKSDDDDADNNDATTKTTLLPLLIHLNLSACNIGDAGVEALALALRDNKGCLLGLDLSGNKIGDEGVMALAEALMDASVSTANKGENNGGGGGVVVEVENVNKLDLSGNADLGDEGAAAIASAFGKGKVQNVSLRSCSIQADGASAFGRAIVLLAKIKRKNGNEEETYDGLEENDDLVLPTYNLDLSGNLFGTVRVEKKKKGLNKHAHKLLKSKTSAKVASQMNFLGRKIQSGLKEAGLDVSPLMEGFKPSAESDDDEEELMAMMGKNTMIETEADARAGAARSSAPRCGARSFADSIVGFDLDGEEEKLKKRGKQQDRKIRLRCRVGMRHCYLDAGAADALAAAVLRARDSWGVDLTFDTSMNRGMIDEESITALSGVCEMRDSGGNGCWRRSTSGESFLKEMAERHLNALNTLAQARRKAVEAAEAAASRVRAEVAFGLAWEGSDEDREDYDEHYDNYDQYDDDIQIGGGWDYDDDIERYDDNYDDFDENY